MEGIYCNGWHVGTRGESQLSRSDFQVYAEAGENEDHGPERTQDESSAH